MTTRRSRSARCFVHVRLSGAAAWLALAAVMVAGCSKVDEAKQEASNANTAVGKAKVCAELATDALGSLRNVQDNPQAARTQAEQLEAKADKVDDAQIKAAALQLANALQTLARTESTDAAGVKKARADALAAGKKTAQRCGVPESAFTG